MGRNISSEQRNKILQYLQEFRKKTPTNDVETLIKINEIEKHIDSETYGIVFEHHTEDVFERLNNEVPVFSIDETRTIKNSGSTSNFILEGDNLHSLYLLARTHKHSIDMIYIDPPYNTGTHDWKYNNNYVDKTDGYRHSKWLSMMNERLKIAKNLLTNDGVLVCAIDENELATISLLLEDVFGLDYHIDTICIVHNPRGVQGDNFSYTNEYALFVYKKGSKPIEDTEIENDEVDWSQFRNWGSESLRSDARNCFYPVYVDENLTVIGCGDVLADDVHPKQTNYNDEKKCFEVYPIDIGGTERKWRYATQSFETIKSMLRAKRTDDGRIEIELGKTFGSYKTVWVGKKFDANTYGTKLINDMVPTNDFDFPKSLYNTYECLNAVVKNKPNAIILDFFAGSGTTGHAVLLMNKMLGGDRKFILCTNNDIGEKKEKEFAKAYPHLVNEDKTLKIESIEYKEWEEKYGIARSITYPRIRAAINGYTSTNGVKTIIFETKVNHNSILDAKKNSKIIEKINQIIKDNKKEYDKIEIKLEDEYLKVYASTKKGSFVNGLGGNLQYFKTDFIKQIDDDYELKDILLEHSAEMVSLREMQLIKYINIILDDDELLEFVKHIDSFEKQVVYISPDVLLGDDEKQIFIKHQVLYFEIPNIFFEKELRKVGEL